MCAGKIHINYLSAFSAQEMTMRLTCEFISRSLPGDAKDIDEAGLVQGIERVVDGSLGEAGHLLHEAFVKFLCIGVAQSPETVHDSHALIRRLHATRDQLSPLVYTIWFHYKLIFNTILEQCQVCPRRTLCDTDLQSRWTTQPSAGYPGRQRGDDAGVLRSTSRRPQAGTRTQRTRKRVLGRYTLDGESV